MTASSNKPTHYEGKLILSNSDLSVQLVRKTPRNRKKKKNDLRSCFSGISKSRMLGNRSLGFKLKISYSSWELLFQVGFLKYL